ncbi:hypothetical protein BH18ACT17_BH18ACT17_08200 [soil metagenome]
MRARPAGGAVDTQRLLTVDDVVAIACAEIGREHLPDHERLGEAVAEPMRRDEGRDMYPGVMLKAAALLLAMSRTRPYPVANAKVSLLVTTVFLNRNGLDLQADDDELVALVAIAATGALSVLQIAAALERFSLRLPQPG